MPTFTCSDTLITPGEGVPGAPGFSTSAAAEFLSDGRCRDRGPCRAHDDGSNKPADLSCSASCGRDTRGRCRSDRTTADRLGLRDRSNCGSRVGRTPDNSCRDRDRPDHGLDPVLTSRQVR